MSLSTIVDVWCDGEGCLLWAAAASGGHNAKEARERAKRTGWGRRKVEDQVADLCPTCLAKLGPTRGHR